MLADTSNFSFPSLQLYVEVPLCLLISVAASLLYNLTLRFLCVIWYQWLNLPFLLIVCWGFFMWISMAAPLLYYFTWRFLCVSWCQRLKLCFPLAPGWDLLGQLTSVTTSHLCNLTLKFLIVSGYQWLQKLFFFITLHLGSYVLADTSYSFPFLWFYNEVHMCHLVFMWDSLCFE